jgi:hypothetical protein
VAFDGVWYCCSRCLEASAADRITEVSQTGPGRRHAIAPPMRLGALLVHRRAITADALQAALDAQRRSGLRLGDQLITLGLASEHDVLRALASQAGIAYVASMDPERVMHGPGGLSREAVRALGVVPFELAQEGGRLRVAAAAPLRRMALAALREMTGFTVEPFLVADALLARLMDAYGAERPDPSAVSAAERVRSVADAAARIARAATEGRVTRMAQTRCDPYVWVRLESANHARDLLLPVEGAEVEEAWLAAPTRH